MFYRASSALVFLACLVAPVRGAPTQLTPRHEEATNATTSIESFQKQNALDAQKLNVQFAALKETDSCIDGAMACVNSAFAQCVQGKWVLSKCPNGLQCFALPLVKQPGTTLVCDSDTDAVLRFKAAGVENGISGTGTASGNTTPAAPTSSTDDDECEDDDTNANDQGDDCEDEDATTHASEQDEDCDETEDTPASSAAVTTDGDEIDCTPVAPTATTTTTILPSSTAVSSSPVVYNLVNSAFAPAGSQIVAGYKRQLQTASLSSSSVVTSSVVSNAQSTVTIYVPTMTPTTTGCCTDSQTTATAKPIDPMTASATTSSIAVDPTSLVRTVTVISTVTVGCGASTSAFPTLVPSSAATVPLSTTSTSFFTSTASESSNTILSSSFSFTTSSIPATSPTSSSGFSSSTLTTSAANRFSFTSVLTTTPTVTNLSISLSSTPTTTPVPSDGVKNGPGNTSFNISELITASV